MTSIEFHYYEKFLLNEVSTLIEFLNKEQLQHGRITEMDAEETRDSYKIFILRRLKFDKSKKLVNVKNICSQKVPYHLKINDCEYALNFDLSKTK